VNLLVAFMCLVVLAGDSNTAHESFIGDGEFVLREYSYLQADYQFTKVAGWGWKSADLLDAMQQLPNDQPCATVILIGTNDALSGVPLWEFESNLRQIVELADNPILNTLPPDAHVDVLPYNAVIYQVAAERDVSVIDLYAAMGYLPQYGLQYDGVHLSTPWDSEPTDFTSDNLHFGFTVRNLLTLNALNNYGGAK